MPFSEGLNSLANPTPKETKQSLFGNPTTKLSVDCVSTMGKTWGLISSCYRSLQMREKESVIVMILYTTYRPRREADHVHLLCCPLDL